MRSAAILGLLCVGCADGCEKEDTAVPRCERVYDVEFTATPLGSAPWDVIDFDLDAEQCGYPDITDEEHFSIVAEDGTVSPLERVTLCNGNEYLAGEAPLEPGRYLELIAHDVDFGPDGSADVALAIDHEVGTYGVDPDLEASGLAGRSFRLQRPMELCGYLGDLVDGLFPGEVWIELTEVDGEDVDFRLIQQFDGGEACLYLEDSATVSASGDFLWETDALELASEPQLDAYDLSLRLGFDAAYEIGGGELDVQVDLAEMRGTQGDEELYWEDFCDSTAGFGIPCVECAVGGLDSCANFVFHGVYGSPATPPFDGSQLEDCEVFLQTEYPSCDFGCSAAPRRQVPLIILGVLGLALARRRRRDQARSAPAHGSGVPGPEARPSR